MNLKKHLRNICKILILNLYLVMILGVDVFAELPNPNIMYRDIKVVCPDNSVKFDSLVLIDGLGYLRAKSIVQYYNASVEDGALSSTIQIKFGETNILFLDGKDYILINGKKIEINKKTFYIDNEFYISLGLLISKVFEQNVKYETKWDYAESVLRIKKPGEAYQNIDVNELVRSAERQKEKADPNTLQNSPTVYQVLSSNEYIKKAKQKRINLVVVDAGHGGKDPGAVSKNRTKEKDINLAVAKKLTEILKTEYGRKVIMTREDDTFIPLRERSAIANKNNADMFISIHANAAPNAKERRGFEIYILSEIASDSEAEEVAQLENAAVSYEENNSNDLNTILWSMVINGFINESSTFCYFVSSNIDSTFSSYKNYENRGVKQAGFRVLKGAKMPAALVELGYVTHRDDLALLLNEDFQWKMAELIAKSISDYENSLDGK